MVDDPPTASKPRSVIDSKLLEKERAAGVSEGMPRGLHVTCGVADVETAEVDDGGKPTVDDEQVARQQVSVNPLLGTFPHGSRQRLLPQAEHLWAVDAAIELVDLPADGLIEIHEGTSSAARLTRMRAGRVDLPERRHESREIHRSLFEILDRAVGILSRQPLVGAPREGIPLVRSSERELDG